MDPGEGQYHSSQEAIAAIDGLPSVYFLRLREWVAYKLVFNAVAEADEVIAEAYLRFEQGSRRWPVDVSIGVCFWNAVRSMVQEAWESHHRRAARLHVPSLADGTPCDPFEQVLDPIEQRLVCDLVAPGVEEHLLSEAKRRALALLIEHVESSFASDEEVTAILIGLEQGLPAREIQQAFGLSETQYDSARRRLRRFLNKHYPNEGQSHGHREKESEPSG